MEKKEIESLVSSFIGKHLNEMYVCMVGSIAYINVSYTDFKPVREVRNYLENIIPMSKVDVDERIFSDDVVANETRLIKSQGLVSDNVPLYVQIEERLFNKCV